MEEDEHITAEMEEEYKKRHYKPQKYVRKKNPVELEKIKCDFRPTCKNNGYLFLKGKCFCRVHNKQLKQLLKELIHFGIRLKND